MKANDTINEEQAALWNGLGGRGWVEAQAALDTMLQPFEDLLVDAVEASGARRVLDVGCGTGSTTLAVARLIGAGGRAVGVDISAPMLELARRRARSEDLAAEFVEGDAQTYAFEPASFDAIVSRFGVMFFDAPVEAFANLRRAAAPDAKLWLAVWRSAADNPFMTAAERAAAPFLPSAPPRDPSAPGQFAFADAERVRGILERSGWGNIEIEPVDVPCALPKIELLRYVTHVGPAGRMLQQVDEATRSRIVAAVTNAFEPYTHGHEIRFVSACWAVRAVART